MARFDYDVDTLPHRFFTVDRLVRDLGIPRDLAITVRKIGKGKINPLDGGYPATERWVRSCYHTPHAAEIALHAIDMLIGCFGVEGWALDNGRGGVSYANTGESYAPTIALITGGWAPEWRLAPCEWLAQQYPAGE